MLFVLIACALFFTGKRAPRSPPLLHSAVALLAYLALPLAGAVLLDCRRRAAPLVLAGSAALVAVVPLVVRSVDSAFAAQVKAWPAALVGAAALSIALSVGAAGRGGVPLSNWGLGLGDWRWWAPRASALLALVAAGATALVAIDPQMAAHYPDYAPARASLPELGFYVAATGLYMVGWEYLFRGLILFGVARSASPFHAILFGAVPFFLTHRGGPTSEMITSFIGAILLGAFCWRSRSYWPAPLMHWGMNAVVQVAAFTWQA